MKKITKKTVKFLKKKITLIGNILFIITKDKPTAFTELKVFKGKYVLTGQFAWDYQYPKLGMGTYELYTR